MGPWGILTVVVAVCLADRGTKSLALERLPRRAGKRAYCACPSIGGCRWPRPCRSGAGGALDPRGGLRLAGGGRLARPAH